MTGQQDVGSADAAAAHAPTAARTVIGRVVSDRMDKTITVLVERRVKHALYGKVVTRSNRYHAHDEANTCKAGDLVEIEATRKLSKLKAWKLVRVVEKAREV
ncbi:MAG TPA: 30S ribosomal protein S17 [Casimicrobiaceae bacterium]|jgi:small subunit ribosomal protein S17